MGQTTRYFHTPTHGKHDPIAYTYENERHCPDCTYERFGCDKDGWIGMENDGFPSLDSERNPVGVLAPWDEWIAFTGEIEVLACATCGREIDRYEPDTETEV